MRLVISGITVMTLMIMSMVMLSIMKELIAEQPYAPVNRDFDAIRLRIETLRADREEQSNALRDRVASWA